MEYKSITEELTESRFRKSIEREFEDYFESNGFNIIEPDIFQNYDDFILSNLIQDTSKTVKVLSGNSKIYILRPDITMNILGKIFSKWDGKPPLKIYYNSRVFKNSSAGKIMMDHQMGVESLGDKSQKADREILEMAINLMESIKTPFVLELGFSKYLDSYFSELNLDYKDELQLRSLISKKNKDELGETLNNLGLNNTLFDVILDMEGNMEDIVQMARNYDMTQEMRIAIDEIDSLISFFKNRNFLRNVNLDLSVMPDVNYYDGIVFKGYCKGTSREIISGGRYDKLTERFGKKVTAIGFIIDLDKATQLRYREGL